MYKFIMGAAIGLVTYVIIEIIMHARKNRED
jgi:hypothetical protein